MQQDFILNDKLALRCPSSEHVITTERNTEIKSLLEEPKNVRSLKMHGFTVPIVTEIPQYLLLSPLFEFLAQTLNISLLGSDKD